VGIESQANPPAPGIKVQYPAKITSVDAVDKYTVRINVSGPDPSIIGYFALNTADQSVRKQLYTRAQQILLTELVHIPLVQDMKYQVVRNRLQNMYVAYTDFNTGLREAWVTG
jgi:ABC-type transport system substrate-binding protein